MRKACTVVDEAFHRRYLFVVQYLRVQVATQVVAHFFPLLRLPRRRSTPAVRLAPLLARQLQHAGPADGELEDVPVRAQEPAQEEQPMAAGELFS